MAVLTVQNAVASTPYTVEAVKVDVTAESALAARDQAFAKAQGDAFTLLAKNLLPPEMFKTFTPPGPGVLAGMIRDYEITEEKLSRTRYSGTYTFRFKEGPVHRYLNIQPDNSFSAQAQPYDPAVPHAAGSYPQGSFLILPFYRNGDVITLWSQDNVWMQSWSESMQGGSTLVTLPIGDLNDVKDIGENQALTYDRSRLQSMTQRYGAQEAVLVVAIADMPQPGALTVNIYRTDRGGPELTQKLFVSNMGQSLNALMNEAVSRTREILRGDWKNNASSVSSAAPGYPSEPAMAQNGGGMAGHYLGSVRFANLQEWAGLQRNISQIPGVSRVVIQSLSPREAILEISYAGDPAALQQDLAPYNVALVGPGMPPVPSYDQPVMRPPMQKPVTYENNFYEPSDQYRRPEPAYLPPPEPANSRDPSSYINNF